MKLIPLLAVVMLLTACGPTPPKSKYEQCMDAANFVREDHVQDVKDFCHMVP